MLNRQCRRNGKDVLYYEPPELVNRRLKEHAIRAGKTA